MNQESHASIIETVRFWLEFLPLCSLEQKEEGKKLTCRYADLQLYYLTRKLKDNERSIKAISEILKAAVEKSAGKSRLLKIKEATR